MNGCEYYYLQKNIDNRRLEMVFTKWKYVQKVLKYTMELVMYNKTALLKLLSTFIYVQ
jgi:hypothetical protein